MSEEEQLRNEMVTAFREIADLLDSQAPMLEIVPSLAELRAALEVVIEKYTSAGDASTRVLEEGAG